MRGGWRIYVLNNPTTFTDPMGLLQNTNSGGNLDTVCYASEPCEVTVYGGPLPGLQPWLTNATGNWMCSWLGENCGNTPSLHFGGSRGNTSNTPPKVASSEKTKHCYSDYAKSKVGKVANFLDPVANWKETVLFTGGKFATLHTLNKAAKLSPDLEVLSVTGSNASKAVPSVLEVTTESILQFAAKIGPFFLVADAAATLGDLTVYSNCYSEGHGLPPPIIAF